MLDLDKLDEKFNDEHCKFDRIEKKRSSYADIHAFLVLEEIFPDGKGRDMVSCAEHDEIWLNVDCSKFSKKATEEQFLELVRCGVRYDSNVESFAMFC